MTLAPAIDLASAASFEAGEGRVGWLEVDLGKLFDPAVAPRLSEEARPASRFPSSDVDLALVVDESLPYARIEAVAYRKKLNRLRTVQLFDIFRSDKIGEGKKSVALSFTFQDEEKTMTDKEIDSMMTQLMEAFESELGAELRK